MCKYQVILFSPSISNIIPLPIDCFTIISLAELSPILWIPPACQCLLEPIHFFFFLSFFKPIYAPTYRTLGNNYFSGFEGEGQHIKNIAEQYTPRTRYYPEYISIRSEEHTSELQSQSNLVC